MTRFNITIQGGIDMIMYAIKNSIGGEIFIPKIPSYKITDLANAICPSCKLKVVGIRPGEKLHEQMIGEEDSYYTYEYPQYFKVLPTIHNWGNSKERIKDGKRVPEGFNYSSDNNSEWMSENELKSWINKNSDYIGKI